MGRWVIVLLAAAAACALVYHFAPSTAGGAFTAHGFQVTWMMMIGIVAVYVGHRLTSK